MLVVFFRLCVRAFRTFIGTLFGPSAKLKALLSQLGFHWFCGMLYISRKLLLSSSNFPLKIVLKLTSCFRRIPVDPYPPSFKVCHAFYCLLCHGFVIDSAGREESNKKMPLHQIPIILYSLKLLVGTLRNWESLCDIRRIATIIYMLAGLLTRYSTSYLHRN